jgi:hypothetical protein
MTKLECEVARRKKKSKELLTENEIDDSSGVIMF